MRENKWILRPRGKANPGADLRLICLPYAGGSASTYVDWVKWLPENVELLAIQPPGRASRIFERPHTKMDDLINDLLLNISENLDKPYVLFGHSLGSRVAFELIARSKDKGIRLPLHFIASASRGPHLSCLRAEIYGLPDDEFINELKTMNGTPEEILGNKELMELYLPVLRADFELADTHRYLQNDLFDIPVSVFGGESDFDIPIDALTSWGNYFINPIDLHMFSGDHFFIESNKRQVVQKINEILEPLLLRSNRIDSNAIAVG